jgi:AraC-like DNA-binding protein
MTAGPSLPFRALEKMLAAAEQAGVAREALLRFAGLAPGTETVTFAELAHCYEEGARRTGDSAFGLHVGEGTSERAYGLLGHLAANCRTLRETFDAIVTYQPLWSRAAGIEVEESAGRVRIEYWHLGAVPPGERRHESEQMLATLLGLVRSALLERVIPREVRFEHLAPADIEEHRRIFGCRLRFGQRSTGMLFESGLLDRPLPHADRDVERLMRQEAQAELGRREVGLTLGPRVAALAEAAIAGGGDSSLGSLADVLGTSPRSLQRHLRAEGTSHRRIVDNVRVAVARRLLTDPSLPLAEVAFRLGYSQAAAFHRAFRRQAGATPGAFRRAMSGGT